MQCEVAVITVQCECAVITVYCECVLFNKTVIDRWWRSTRAQYLENLIVSHSLPFCCLQSDPHCNDDCLLCSAIGQ